MSVLDRAWFAYALGGAVVAAIFWPVIRGHDTFPASNYPMFAEKRGRQATLNHAVAVANDGARVVLSPRYFGTDEVLQAKATLDRAVRAADGGRKLCEEVAARVAREGLLHASHVEIRSVTYDAIDYFASPAAPPLADQLRTSCPVVSEVH